MRVLVVDDVMTTREGLATILERVRGVENVYCCDSRNGALEAIRRQNFNFALIDLQLGTENGILLGRELLAVNPNLKVFIYTKEASIVIAAEIFRHDQPVVFQAQAGLLAKTATLNAPRRIGAKANVVSLHGYILLKNMTPSTLELYFQTQSGLSVIDPEISRLLLDRLNLLSLTPRESECSELIAQAKSNREIAQTLGISQQAVENLINSLYNKLSIGGEPKDPGRRVMLALTMQRWRGLSQEQIAV